MVALRNWWEGLEAHPLNNNGVAPNYVRSKSYLSSIPKNSDSREAASGAIIRFPYGAQNTDELQEWVKGLVYSHSQVGSDLRPLSPTYSPEQQDRAYESYLTGKSKIAARRKKLAAGIAPVASWGDDEIPVSPDFHITASNKVGAKNTWH
jgi:hypothetical protein